MTTEFARYPLRLPSTRTSHEDDAFSTPGDSGSIVADGEGRIDGILTGGAGRTDSTDVSYLSPYYWVERHITAAFPNAHLYPIIA